MTEKDFKEEKIIQFYGKIIELQTAKENLTKYPSLYYPISLLKPYTKEEIKKALNNAILLNQNSKDRDEYILALKLGKRQIEFFISDKEAFKKNDFTGRALRAEKIKTDTFYTPMQKFVLLLKLAGVDTKAGDNFKRLTETDLDNADEVVKLWRELVPVAFNNWIDKNSYSTILSSEIKIQSILEKNDIGLRQVDEKNMKNTKLFTTPENYKNPLAVKMVLGIFLAAFVYVLFLIAFGIFSAIYTFIKLAG
jgi:hypothetical protein